MPLYYRQWLERSGSEWPALASAAERAPHFIALNNVRAALDWCFGPGGDAEIGVGLAAAAVPVFLTMSLLPECHRWSEQALFALGDATGGDADEMHLQAGLGISSMFLHGESEAARAALNRSLAIAEARGDLLHQAGMLGVLHMFHFRSGEFKTAVQYARRCRAVARTAEDPAAMALAHSILGRSLCFRASWTMHAWSCRLRSRHWCVRRRRRSIWPLIATMGRRRAGADPVADGLSGPGRGARPPDHRRGRAHGSSGIAGGRMPGMGGVDLSLGRRLQGRRRAHRFAGVACRVHSLGPLSAVGRARKAELAIRRGQGTSGG